MFSKEKIIGEWKRIHNKRNPNLHELKLKLNSVALVRKLTIPTERPLLVGEVSAKFADRGCRVVSATDPHGR
jgi:hypothetical protein